MSRRVVIVISGASGALYGLRALALLRMVPDVEAHLVVTASGRATIRQETDYSIDAVYALADFVHSDNDLGAPISSGSFVNEGVLVAPCSVKTLSAVANSYDATLGVRACDVALKEGRPVVLLLRETPLHAGHLRLMKQAASMGVIVMPPVPAFYMRPKSIEEIVDHTAGRALDLIGIQTPDLHRWDAERRKASGATPPRESAGK